jgi:NurA-like 5'-3' nuclease
LASYISFPRSTEVVNALKLAVCPYDNVNCDKYCSGANIQRACDKVSGLIDRDVFNRLLKVGERSAIFNSRSSVVEKYYGSHRICFFYIRLENEVCRVEIPEWIANREDIVEFIHSAILRQCELGFGYPVALMEAHEQAVVTGSDREQFWQMIEQISDEDYIQSRTSAKQWSKKIKWI